MKEIIYMSLLAFQQLIFWDAAWNFVLDRMKVKFNRVNIYARWGIYVVTAIAIETYFAMAG